MAEERPPLPPTPGCHMGRQNLELSQIFSHKLEQIAVESVGFGVNRGVCVCVCLCVCLCGGGGGGHPTDLQTSNPTLPPPSTQIPVNLCLLTSQHSSGQARIAWSYQT